MYTLLGIVAAPPRTADEWRQAQLRRDPRLLTQDDCVRVHAADLSAAAWDAPFIITNASDRAALDLISMPRLRREFGNVTVKLGDAGSLVENGLGEQPRTSLKDALCFQCPTARDAEFNRITFTPLQDVLPADEVRQLLAAFTRTQLASTRRLNRFTLTAASFGHGIGWHHHAEAFFFLASGRKKWYVGEVDTRGPPQWPCSLIFALVNRPHMVEDARQHPRMPRGRAAPAQLEQALRNICIPDARTRSCIQEAGEIMFVPDMWSHEIFNIERTVGVQAMYTPGSPSALSLLHPDQRMIKSEL